MTMTVQQTHDFKPCVPGAFRGGLSRTLFFDGMVLSEDDMMREQAYWRMKRRLTNRALGQGVVWGLGLHWDERTRSFTLCPGYGLSCCGDDLVVECPETVREGELIDPCSEEFRRLLANPADRCEEDPRPDAPVEACLMLEYVECPEDPRRVYEDPCAEAPKGCRFGAVRETTRLRLVRPPAPEPAGPIERFCKAVEETRAALATVDNSPLPDGSLQTALTLNRIVATTGATQTASANVVLANGSSVSAKVFHGSPVADSSATYVYGLEPPPGYFFASVRIGMEDSTGTATLMRIRESLTNAEFQVLQQDVQVELAPLFGSGKSLLVTYHISGSIGTLNSALGVDITALEEIPQRCDCASLLANGLFAKDGGCTLRTLAMALVHGWFAGTLGAAPCCDPPQMEASPGREALAWMACRTAWEVLFGIDIANAPEVQKCLRRLFAEWCEGFHYKGPRCETNAHGIILGCVQISPKGRILCFREWPHRRYVLTGPLLTHWAGQIGLPPLDVAAGRLASWICCIAQAPLARPSDVVTGTRWPLVNTVVYQSRAAAEAAAPAATARWREVAPAAFVSETLAEMMRFNRTPLENATSVEIVSMRGADFHVVRPSELAAPVSVARADAVRDEVATNAGAAPSMARAPIVDFVVGLAELVPVTAIRPQVESKSFDAAVAALEEAEVTTVADLIRIGPEPAAERARAKLAANPDFADPSAVDRSIAAVFDVAAKALADTADAIAGEAKGRDPEEAFTRADLIESGTVSAARSAVNSHLKGRGLSNKALREIAETAAAAKP